MNDKQRKYRVLFVDDEPRVTSALKAMFRREYEVLTANSGDEAIELIKLTKVNVIVSDQRMPGMLGNEVLAKVAKLSPQTMRILLTGFMDREAIVDSINEGEVYRFLNKPWNNDEMRELLGEASLASEIPVAPRRKRRVKKPKTKKTKTKKQESSKAESAKPSPFAGLSLLMMENNSDVRLQIRKFCSDQEVMIYGTQSLEQAIAAASARDSIGVVVMELASDTEAAIQTISLLRQARPELVFIALTSEYDADIAVELINKGQVFKYLAKPLKLEDFENTVEDAFLRHQYLKTHKEAQSRFKASSDFENILSEVKAIFSKFFS